MSKFTIVVTPTKKGLYKDGKLGPSWDSKDTLEYVYKQATNHMAPKDTIVEVEMDVLPANLPKPKPVPTAGEVGGLRKDK